MVSSSLVFDPLRKTLCKRTLCDPIHPAYSFGLDATQLKPGLQLSREELDEMAQGCKGEIVSVLTWVLCDGHIEIARTILEF